MSTITLQIHGHPYEVSCEDGQEGHLQMLATALSKKLDDFEAQFPGLGGVKLPENYLWMLVALTLQDETQELRQNLERQRGESAHSSQSFEQGKRIEMEQTVVETLEEITTRVERLSASV